ncbi:proteasome assembly chaperone 1-like [Actinia tenebrosa]|uniref:Proteasome assembly chaperone 1 n=1 Tax=Actinia tenebrosa TaxID=6105 RepID=A0A6P8HKH7_ACTTE|nr:proteasome assembly chaperone 1-like [Actinia tenebrosa]
MAAHFGVWELRFPSSRAVDEDDDEEDEITEEKERQISPLILWSPKITESLKDCQENVVKCSTLVLGFDKVASTFLEAHFLCGSNSEIIGAVSRKDNEKDFSSVVKSTNVEKVSFLYRLKKNDDVIFCKCPSHVEENVAFLWSRKVFDNVRPSKVIILSSAPACEYSTSDPSNLKSDFVKMLHTTAWNKSNEKTDIGFVETPNTIRGVAAAVLNHCQVYNVPAALYVCYAASLHLEAQSVETFSILLTSKEFSGLNKSPKEETSKVLKALGIGKTHDNLYV